MTASQAAERLAALLGFGMQPADVEQRLRVLEAEGYIAILPRQPTLEAVVPVLLVPTDKAGAYAAAVVAEINRLTGRAFKPAKEAVSQAKALIRAKVDIDTMLAMIRFVAEKWIKDPKMAEFIQPSTLMRVSNAKKYIAQMEAGPVKTGQHKPVFRKLGDG